MPNKGTQLKRDKKKRMWKEMEKVKERKNEDE